MINVKENSYCSGCSACSSICPKKAITMEEDKNGFLYPKIDENLCINCNLCEKKCPVLNMVDKTDEIISSYVGYYKNEDVRLDSSSGGIFTVIAEYVLNKNGVVFGAMYDDDFMVHHSFIEKCSDLYKIRGSKYLQSRIEDSFFECKGFLDNGRLVLFSGTECQIAGLHSFLGKKYDNLITVDILCHGVPSPKLWKKYLSYKGEKSIKNINFRDKKTGWKNFSISIDSNEKCKYCATHDRDPYMNLFLSNICLRESCYNCRFKKLDRTSDITLGDAWAINKVNKSLNDNKGASIIIIHTNQGENVFENISNELEYINCEIDMILPSSSDSRKSVSKHKNYYAFFELLSNDDVGFEKYLKLVKKKNKILIITKKIIRKIFR